MNSLFFWRVAHRGFFFSPVGGPRRSPVSFFAAHIHIKSYVLKDQNVASLYTIKQERPVMLYLWHDGLVRRPGNGLENSAECFYNNKDEYGLEVKE